jgi:hypothetical protein
MEKPKPKTKPGKGPAVKPPPLADSLPGDPHTVGLPTIQELAVIAATVAGNSEKGSPVKSWTDEQNLDWAEENVWAAMRLWIVARKRILLAVETSEIKTEDDDFENEIYPHQNDPFPNEECRSSESPVTRDLFLRTMLPKYKSRSADLARIGKAFLWNILLDRFQREPTRDEIADAYGKWNRKPYANSEMANAAARQFVNWYADYIKNIRRFAGLKSAARKVAIKKIPSLRSK